MNPSTKSVACILLISFALAALLVKAAPTSHEIEDDSQMGGPIGDESSSADPEMDIEQANARAGQAGSDDMSDDGVSNVDPHDAQDSNVAKVQVTGEDLAAAAGHHYSGHGHGVSGKMEMGAHTEKKGAFGWHAKFPVGGKGRR